MQAMHVRQNQQEKALLCPHPAHGPCGSQREAEPARRRRGVELDARGQAEADKQARHHARQTAQAVPFSFQPTRVGLPAFSTEPATLGSVERPTVSGILASSLHLPAF